MSQRRALALAVALLALVTATATGAAEARQAPSPCVRAGQAKYPVDYEWKDGSGAQQGLGRATVETTPALWGGQIAPGSTFTLRIAHTTFRWPGVGYTSTWDISSLVANADIISQSGDGTVGGGVLTISSHLGIDSEPKVITFRVKQGTAGRGMAVKPRDITSYGLFGQFAGNTPAPQIQIADGRSISPTTAVNDTATTRHDTAVAIPVLANDAGTAMGVMITAVGRPARGTAMLSGDRIMYSPPPGSVTDTFTYTITTPCGTGTGTVTVVVTCAADPMTLANGGFESPYVDSGRRDVPDAATDPAAGWRTTASGGMLTIRRGGFQGVYSAEGRQFAELGATGPSAVYQDVRTVPGRSMPWSMWHRGGAGTDVMRVLIGAPGATVAQTPDGATSRDIATDGTAWRRYSGTYFVAPGQTTTRFSFQAVSSADGGATGNFLDGVVLQTVPCRPIN